MQLDEVWCLPDVSLLAGGVLRQAEVRPRTLVVSEHLNLCDVSVLADILDVHFSHRCCVQRGCWKYGRFGGGGDGRDGCVGYDADPVVDVVILRREGWDSNKRDDLAL